MLFGRLQDFICGDHNAKIDHLVVIALQNHADDIFTNIVDITLHRCHYDLAFGFGLFALFGFDIGD